MDGDTRQINTCLAVQTQLTDGPGGRTVWGGPSAVTLSALGKRTPIDLRASLRGSCNGGSTSDAIEPGRRPPSGGRATRPGIPRPTNRRTAPHVDRLLSDGCGTHM